MPRLIFAVIALGLAAAPALAAPVSVSPTQPLYVISFTNDCLTKISPDGSKSAFATTGVNPFGLAFDVSGNLFVSNTGDNDITEYAYSNGTLTASSSIFASGLSGPRGLAFSPSVIAGAPEPSPWAALGFTGLGIGGLLWRARKRKASAA